MGQRIKRLRCGNGSKLFSCVGNVQSSSVLKCPLQELPPLYASFSLLSPPVLRWLLSLRFELPHGGYLHIPSCGSLSSKSEGEWLRHRPISFEEDTSAGRLEGGVLRRGWDSSASCWRVLMDPCWSGRLSAWAQTIFFPMPKKNPSSTEKSSQTLTRSFKLIFKIFIFFKKIFNTKLGEKNVKK